MLHAVFDALFEQRVALEGMLLKPNMVVAGRDCPRQASVEEVAAATLARAGADVPPAVPGSRLPVGRAGSPCWPPSTSTPSTSWTAPKPWKLSFSYGRALQDEALEAWQGKRENVARGPARVPPPRPVRQRRGAGPVPRRDGERAAAYGAESKERTAVAHGCDDSTGDSGNGAPSCERAWLVGEPFGARSRRSAHRQRAGVDERLLAGLQLPLGGDDLPQGQPAAAAAPRGRRRQASAARPLGREPGAVVRRGST